MAIKSAWQKGVELYAQELKEFLTENNLAPTMENMLNGAKDWKQFSYGDGSLIYNWDIAKRLCNPSELKRTMSGQKPPNKSEQWLDVQARALYQAAYMIIRGEI